MKYAFAILLFLTSLTPHAKTGSDVSFTKSNPDCKRECPKRLKIGQQSKIYSARSKLENSAVFYDKSWALVSDYIVPSGEKKRVKTYFLHSSEYRRPTKLTNLCSGLSRDISYIGSLVCMQPSKIIIEGTHLGHKRTTFELEEQVQVGVVVSAINGETTLAYIDQKEYGLYVNSLSRLNQQRPWLNSPTSLHYGSDMQDIIDIDAYNNNGFIVALYEYINDSARGIALFNFNENGLVAKSIPHKSADNIGFNPRVRTTRDGIEVKAQNSSKDTIETFNYSNEFLQNMTYVRYDDHIPDTINFMAGAGFQPAFWNASQSVEVNEVEKASTDYDMNTNMLFSYYIQGRWGKSQLAVTLLQNKAESELDELTDNDLISEAINKYIIQYDYNGLFSGSSTLRIGYSSLDAGGIASFKDGDNTVERAFESSKETFEILLMQERGVFAGVFYSEMGAPGQVGFGTNAGRYIGATFDDSITISNYGLMVGYDEAAYGYRYETNYSRFYYNFIGTLSLSELEVSRDALERVTGERQGDIHGLFGIGFGVTGELGYIWQRKIQSLGGLGASFQLGYRASWEPYSSTWDDEDDFEDDGYYVNYVRSDIIHGPYLNINVLF